LRSLTGIGAFFREGIKRQAVPLFDKAGGYLVTFGLERTQALRLRDGGAKPIEGIDERQRLETGDNILRPAQPFAGCDLVFQFGQRSLLLQGKVANAHSLFEKIFERENRVLRRVLGKLWRDFKGGDVTFDLADALVLKIVDLDRARDGRGLIRLAKSAVGDYQHSGGRQRRPGRQAVDVRGSVGAAGVQCRERGPRNFGDEPLGTAATA
jgi:hypothetical protein